MELSEQILRKKLETLKSDYDYILIDAPPNWRFYSISAVYAADVVLIPTKHNNVRSLQNAAKTIQQYIPEIQQSRQQKTQSLEWGAIALPIFFISNSDGRNWIPLVVKEIAEDRYQVIGNNFIYAVAEAAGLEKVWCIIADDSEITAKLSRMLAREEIPRINLSTASSDDIKSALEYLTEQPDTPLKRIDIHKTTNRIDESPRQYWQDFKPITKLGCGITVGKKVKALEQVFYLTPKPMPNDIKDPKVLNCLTTAELKKIAKQRKLSGYSKFNKSKLVNLLSK